MDWCRKRSVIMVSSQLAMGNHELLSNPNSCTLQVNSLIEKVQVTATKELQENANHKERTQLM